MRDSASETRPNAAKAPSIARGAAGRFAAEMVALVSTQIAGVIAARLLGPAGRGVGGVAALVASVGVLAFDLGLTTAIVYWIGRGTYTAKSVASTVLTLALIAGVPLAAVIVLTRDSLAQLLLRGSYGYLIMLVALATPATLAYSWLVSVLRGRQQLLAPSAIHVGATLTGAATLIISLAVFDQGPAAMVWSMNATALVGSIACYVLLRRDLAIRPELNIAFLRDAVRFGVKSQIGQFLQLINYRFDLFIMNMLLGSAAVGVYGVGAGIAQLLWYVPNSLSYALFSIVPASTPEKARDETVAVARRSFLASAAGALVLVIAGPFLIPLLFGAAFRGSARALAILLPGVAALSHYKTLGTYFGGSGRPEYYSYAAGAGAVCTLALDFSLMPLLGIDGAALASTVAYVLSSALCVRWFIKQNPSVHLRDLFIPQLSDARLLRRMLERLQFRLKLSR